MVKANDGPGCTLGFFVDCISGKMTHIKSNSHLMMKKLIVANWKENPVTVRKAKDLFNAVKKGIRDAEGLEVVICPPFVYLAMLKGLTLGAQNVSYEEKGAFTGEVSALMLKDLRVKYVIVGHSESRRHFGDTDEIINEKLKEVLHVGLTPIFCVGEKEGEDKNAVLYRQITEGLKEVSKNDAGKIVIVYEPVWAIGTEKNCSVKETVETIRSIKGLLSEMYGEFPKIRILYGGSVNAQNVEEYLKEGEIDGLLVGGASLKAAEFTSIVELAS